jgi:cysteine synthase B
MEAYGADVIRTAEGETIEDARRLAERLARERGWGQLNQFANPDNWRMHYRTTGPEVWADTQGTVSHFVSSMGTTGTIMGTSRYLKEVSEEAVREGARPAPVTIVGVQPVEGSRIPGIRKWSPEMTPAIYEPERVDTLEYVSADEATGMARRLAREEGILGGMSSGGALTAALRVGRSLEEGTVVFIVCDRGDRYLSSGLFGEESA